MYIRNEVTHMVTLTSFFLGRTDLKLYFLSCKNTESTHMFSIVKQHSTHIHMHVAMPMHMG